MEALNTFLVSSCSPTNLIDGGLICELVLLSVDVVTRLTKCIILLNLSPETLLYAYEWIFFTQGATSHAQTHDYTPLLTNSFTRNGIDKTNLTNRKLIGFLWSDDCYAASVVLPESC